MPKEKIKSPNHFEKHLGHLSDNDKKKVRALLQEFMTSMRKLLVECHHQLAELYLERHPGCATCAFATDTDKWPGFCATTYGLVWAMVNDKLFLCHSNQVGWKNGELDPESLVCCENWLTARSVYPIESKELACKTMAAIKKLGTEV